MVGNKEQLKSHPSRAGPQESVAATGSSTPDRSEQLPQQAELAHLIDSDEQVNRLPEAAEYNPAVELLVADQPKSLVGQVISHYKFLRYIGGGGMGRVYLAEDTCLGRKVALKLLQSEFTTDQVQLRHFQGEAYAASALNHPNILTIYEFGQAEGLHFMATEFIEGETLRRRIAASKMEIGEALDVAVQIACALEAAHAAGIVHRDIKPENIMLRPDGYIKVLDFGLAKLSRVLPVPADIGAAGPRAERGRPPGRQSTSVDTEAPTLPALDTDLGLVMGTVRYMSPEQLQGLEVDARTDIFSLGVVVYEMMTGKRPFVGETANDLLNSMQASEPPPLIYYPAKVPAELQHIITKALAKDREERYQVVKDMLIDLRNLRKELTIGVLLERSLSSDLGAWKSSRVPIFIGLMLAVAIPVLYYIWAPSNLKRTDAAPSIKSIAVLPFKQVGTDTSHEHLGMGMADTLISRLGNARRIVVRPASAVGRYSTPDQDPITAGRELRVDAVLDGRIEQLCDHVLVTVRLVSVRDGKLIWDDKFYDKSINISAVQDSISEQVSQALMLNLTVHERSLLTKHYTNSIEAYQAYLKGRHHWDKRTREGLQMSIEHFNHAIEKDPAYALAYVGLADSYLLLSSYDHLSPGEAITKAKAAATIALQRDEELAEALTSVAYINFTFEWDWSAAEINFKRAIELQPNYSTAHHWYALHLAARGQLYEALVEIKRAQELDPLSPIINRNAGRILYYARRYDEAIEECDKILRMEQDFPPARWLLGLAQLEKGRFREAIAELKKIADLESGISVRLGYAYAVSGRRGEALEILTILMRQANRRAAVAYDIAAIYVGLGDKERAFEWLDNAYEARSEWVVWLNVDPIFDPLRSDPRFQDLARRVGLSP